MSALLNGAFNKHLKFADMIQVYEDSFVVVLYDKAQDLIEYCYKPNKGMLDDVYIKSMTKYGEATELYKPSKLLVNTVNSLYTIPPELQEWTAKEIAPKTVCLKQLAFLLPKDIFSQVALEQMLDEKGISDVYSGIRYFEDLGEAEKWLGVRSNFSV